MRGVCAGMVRAIVYLTGDLPPQLRSCPPRGSTQGQSQRVVVAYLERNPGRLHLDFEDLAIDALREAWPCRR